MQHKVFKCVSQHYLNSLPMHFYCLFSIVCYGANHLVPHRCQPRAWAYVFWLLALQWMGGHHILPVGRCDAHVLVRLFHVLAAHLPGQQPFLLLQTGRWQPASSRLQQSCQKCPRLRLEILEIPRGLLYCT